MKLTPVVLENEWVRLEPLSAAHHDELIAAESDASIWTFQPQDPAGGPHAHWLALWMKAALTAHDEGREVVFVVRHKRDGRVVGSTRYLNLALAHRRVEIGGTWYTPAARGGEVNPACKLALFAHAFDELACLRVELKADLRNTRSQAAISKLGAVREGVFRKHMILGDGFVRDTVYFSVVDDEWPAVRASLRSRLG